MMPTALNSDTLNPLVSAQTCAAAAYAAEGRQFSSKTRKSQNLGSLV
jgi:hypothetical protein